MRRELLESLVAARDAGRAVLLLTPLDGGAQRLFTADELAAIAPAEPELAQVGALALRSDRAARVMQDGVEALLTPFNPPLRLVVVGAVHIAEALCRMAIVGGYNVTVVDPRSSFLRPELFPDVALSADWPQQAFARIRPDARTAVVLLSHDPKIDDPALLAVLPGDAFYVGALGSTRTHAKRLARLAEIAAVGVPGNPRREFRAGLEIVIAGLKASSVSARRAAGARPTR